MIGFIFLSVGLFVPYRHANRCHPGLQSLAGICNTEPRSVRYETPVLYAKTVSIHFEY